MSEPQDPDILRLDREQARRELGETLAELTGKLDVPGRARTSVHERTQAARDKVTDAKFHALHTADQARDKADHALDKTRQAAANLESAIPAPVAARGRQAAEVARKPAVPVTALAVLTGVVVWLAIRRRRP